MWMGKNDYYRRIIRVHLTCTFSRSQIVTLACTMHETVFVFAAGCSVTLCLGDYFRSIFFLLIAGKGNMQFVWSHSYFITFLRWPCSHFSRLSPTSMTMREQERENKREREGHYYSWSRIVKVLGRRRQWKRKYQTTIIDFRVLFASCLLFTVANVGCAQSIDWLLMWDECQIWFSPL